MWRAHRRHRTFLQHRRILFAAGCGTLAAALAVSGCGTAAISPGTGTPQDGGAVTYALPPDSAPTYIFPFTPGAYFTNINSGNLQQLLYRPLYWYTITSCQSRARCGSAGTALLNTSLSLADKPVYKGQQVTIFMKHWRWSNGQPVDADNVLFWMHMLQAERGEWGGYVQGDFPDNVTNITKTGKYTVTMTIKGTYSQMWFTDNELSQITPMPETWDRTATGASNCTNASGALPATQQAKNCVAVWKYLNSQSTDTTKFVRPLWSVVDGPWKLTGLNSQKVWTFSYNKSYSGPVPRHHITTFQELYFTSEEAEYNVLQAGGSQRIDVGYLPTVDAPVPPTGAAVGTNPVPGYQLQPLYSWGLNYFVYNFSNTTGVAPIFKQLYFRQAFQYLINQAQIIDGPLHGYGQPSVGPVGDYPPTSFLSPQARRGTPFTYDPVRAAALLRDHGWTIHPGGATTCTNPGPGPQQCGQGIGRGKQLVLELQYAQGTDWVESAMKQIKSNDAQVGIQLQLKAESFDNVISNSYACTAQTTKITNCPWQLANWGGGWSYVPDFLPTGEELFQTRSSGNAGNYSNLLNDQLIKGTLKNFTYHGFWQWQNYLAGQLPVVMQPNAPYALIESINNLHIGTQSATLSITPEDWYLTR